MRGRCAADGVFDISAVLCNTSPIKYNYMEV
jgi:hypothetical protein